MKSYAQFCPVAQALEVLAERWTLLVVRELLMGSTRFGEIARGVPLMSRTLLSQRLQTLQDCGIIGRREGDGGPEYHLTERGENLRPVIETIGVWGKRHGGGELRDDQLDPKLLMWDLQRRLHLDRLPRERTVVMFRFSGAEAGESRYWLHLTRPEADLCLRSAGFDVDLTVESDLRAFTEVWTGKRALAQAIRARAVRLSGPAHLKRAFSSWLKLSVFADA
ncbi:MAG: helix-turn-helix transcriptional regulator [Myxococcota bacterium]|nr:helix-turn-helix transcriptional regulator [Myxococcota bacterium]